MKSSALLLGLCLLALAACAGAPTTAPPTPSATVGATPTVAATPTPTVATPSPTLATTAPTSPPPSATVAAAACDTVLTAADVPGWRQTYLRPLDPVLAGPGVIAGTQVGFETAIGDTVGNTVACFDSAANAMAAYDNWGSSCITEGRQDVTVSATVGDAVKVVYCPAGQFQGANVAQSLSLYSVLGTTAFSVTANGAPYAPTEAAVAVLVRLANALVGRLPS
jgi:hypothetical protein